MRLIYLCVAVFLATGLNGCQQESADPEKSEMKREAVVAPPAMTIEKKMKTVEKSVEVAKEKVEAAVVATAEIAEDVTAKDPEKLVEPVLSTPAKVKEEAMVEETPVAVKTVADSPAPMPLGDAVKGAKIAKGKCGACHYFDKDRKKMGPSLMGIYGRAPSIDAVPFATWDAASLDRWLESPRAVKSNTKMAFKGIPEKARRDDIIAYLKTL